jgi:hypothetical protein
MFSVSTTERMLLKKKMHYSTILQELLLPTLRVYGNCSNPTFLSFYTRSYD